MSLTPTAEPTTEVHRRGHLFTYPDTGAPKTTSRLEGGINAVIKQVLRQHRGMPVEDQRRAAEWVLLERAGLLHTAATIDTQAAVNPPTKKRPTFTEPDPGPVLYGTGLEAGEGLWERSGWAGRDKHARTHPLFIADKPLRVIGQNVWMDLSSNRATMR